jgi:hypothetical protein
VRVEVSEAKRALDLVEFLRGMGYLVRVVDDTAVEAVLPHAPTEAALHDLEALLRVWEREHAVVAGRSWLNGNGAA